MDAQEIRVESNAKLTAKPTAMAWVCLCGAAFFFVEFLRKLDDPFYRKHPENFYFFLLFIGLGVLSFVLLRLTHVTISRGNVIDHVPMFRHREIPISELREIEDDGTALILRALHGRKISVFKGHSGADAVIDELERLRPDLFGDR